MRVACRLTAIARKAAADAVRPGVTTGEIDRIVRKTIEDAGGEALFPRLRRLSRQRLCIDQRRGHPRHSLGAPAWCTRVTS